MIRRKRQREEEVAPNQVSSRDVNSETDETEVHVDDVEVDEGSSMSDTVNTCTDINVTEENESIHSSHSEVGRSISTVASACDIPVTVQTVNVATQTSIKKTREAIVQTYGERTAVYGCDLIRDNDQNVKFYTGLHSWLVFMHILSLVAPHVPKKRSSTALKLEDELLLVLMKLRLNLLFDDLAIRFHISQSTAIDLFSKWIDVMFIRLKFLIFWPEKDIVKANMPQIFKDTYPDARCIIDCSKIFIERPLVYKARAQTYSNYKKHNTVKILIAISPNGVITFVLKCWGGRVTDKEITRMCGFLDLLDPGDVVLADRGFNIGEDIGLHRAKLEIPAFKKRGQDQFSQKDVEFSARLAKVHIHIERVIGLLKNKYTILQGTLPIRLIKHKNDSEYSHIDKIVSICCALTNLSQSIVPC